MSGEIYPLCTSGRRLEWNYVIKYHGGDTQSFIKPCISLPFENMSRNAVAHTSYENSLSNLSITYGGFIHKKTVRHVTYKT